MPVLIPTRPLSERLRMGFRGAQGPASLLEDGQGKPHLPQQTPSAAPAPFCAACSGCPGTLASGEAAQLSEKWSPGSSTKWAGP